MIIILGVFGLLVTTARAGDIDGQWHAEFDTQIGTQKYTFTFQQDGTNVTGKAEAVVNDQKRKAELKDGSIQGEMRGISKGFPGVKALDNVSLQIGRGEVVALCGENGAGKSVRANRCGQIGV